MPYFFVANWKMYMHLNDVTAFCTEHNKELQALSTKHSLIICPSFIALPQTIELLKNTSIKYGAQDCSAFASGAYTGQISAQDLANIGCSYCIIGHAEHREYYNETNEAIAEKAVRLLENNITPIICIGENKTDSINGRTYSALEEQLSPIFIRLQAHTSEHKKLIFAYEPTWAIGTGVTPEQEYISNVFTYIQEESSKHLSHYTIQLLYGGSVNATSIKKLNAIPTIDGFFIGEASTDFKQLQSIIKACETPIL